MNMMWFINPLALNDPMSAIATLNPAVIIPLIAIPTPFIFIICIVGFKLLTEYRVRKLQQETIIHMVEKGLSIPPELLKSGETKKVRDDRRTSLILIACGIALFVFFNNGPILADDQYNEARWLGAIPGFIGLALLLNWFLEKFDKNKKDER